MLEVALQSNRSDTALNYRYALLLRKIASDRHLELIHSFARAFEPGDDNYVAQFWFARYAYESGDLADRAKAKEIFRGLRRARVPVAVRAKIRDKVVDSSGAARRFRGSIKRLQETYGVVEREDNRDWSDLKRRTNANIWSSLRLGQTISFSIGYSYSGPVAFDVAIEGPRQ